MGKGMTLFVKPFTRAEVRYFDSSDSDAAAQWILEKQSYPAWNCLQIQYSLGLFEYRRVPGTMLHRLTVPAESITMRVVD